MSNLKMPYKNPNDPRSKESIIKTRKKYYDAHKNNPEFIMERRINNKIQYDKNKEKRKQKQREYRMNKLSVEEVLYYNAKNRAKAHNVPFNIEVSDIVVPTFCPMLGIEIKKASNHAQDYSPSIDRIIPELGYVKNNIQIICHKANTIKSNATFSEIEKLYFFMRRKTIESNIKCIADGVAHVRK